MGEGVDPSTLVSCIHNIFFGYTIELLDTLKKKSLMNSMNSPMARKKSMELLELEPRGVA